MSTHRKRGKPDPRSELRGRIRKLVNEAGGQTAFARRVWPDKDPLGQKGKVGKWYNGPTGISADEARAVAEAFGRNAAWLLWNEGPERQGTSRNDATLAADVAAYMRNAIVNRLFTLGEGPNDLRFEDVVDQIIIDEEKLLPEMAERLWLQTRIVAIRPSALRRLGLAEPSSAISIA